MVNNPVRWPLGLTTGRQKNRACKSDHKKTLILLGERRRQVTYLAVIFPVPRHLYQKTAKPSWSFCSVQRTGISMTQTMETGERVTYYIPPKPAGHLSGQSMIPTHSSTGREKAEPKKWEADISTKVRQSVCLESWLQIFSFRKTRANWEAASIAWHSHSPPLERRNLQRSSLCWPFFRVLLKVNFQKC